jgi:hypothetical protein
MCVYIYIYFFLFLFHSTVRLREIHELTNAAGRHVLTTLLRNDAEHHLHGHLRGNAQTPTIRTYTSVEDRLNDSERLVMVTTATAISSHYGGWIMAATCAPVPSRAIESRNSYVSEANTLRSYVNV